MTRYQKFFKYVSSYDLSHRLNIMNSFSLPDLTAISINISSRNVEKNKIIEFFTILELLSGQTSQLTFSKKNKIQFKIKKGMLIGCKVTLNKRKSYEFLEILTTLIFPPTKFLTGFPLATNPQFFSLTLRNTQPFPEVTQEFGFNDCPINVTVQIHSTTLKATNLFLSSLNFPLQTKSLRK